MSEDKPRRFQIPKPGVLLAVAIVLVVIAVLLTVRVSYHRQRGAINEIERFGGSVMTGGPAWLRDLVGDKWMKYFERAYSVNFSSEQGDDVLKHLNKLANLKVLQLSGTQVSDAGLKHLSSLTQLTILGLEATQVTDAGLKHLNELANLRWLQLSGTQVSDAGLKHLNGLTNLEWLSLDGRISDAGLKHLSGLNNLSYLSLERTQVTTKGMKSLKQKLPDCEIIW